MLSPLHNFTLSDSGLSLSGGHPLQVTKLQQLAMCAQKMQIWSTVWGGHVWFLWYLKTWHGIKSHTNCRNNDKHHWKKRDKIGCTWRLRMLHQVPHTLLILATPVVGELLKERVYQGCALWGGKAWTYLWCILLHLKTFIFHFLVYEGKLPLVLVSTATFQDWIVYSPVLQVSLEKVKLFF